VARADELDDFGGGNHVVHAPAVGAADVHVLDEARDVPCAAPALGHRQHVGVVHAALDHHVDLDRRHAGGRRGVDALDHPRHRKVGVVDGTEGGVIERIEAHRDALQARLGQRAGLLRQQRAVGGQRQVEPRNRGEQRHQPVQLATHQRLAAGDADFLHAEPGEQARQARDLLEAENFLVRQEFEVAAERFPRHAVDAAEIAAVGDRDAQVAQAARERVRQRPAVVGGGRRMRRTDGKNLLRHGVFTNVGS
jgi:hypothetical protein